MFRLLNVISLTFLCLIMVTQSESIHRAKRNLNNPMGSNKEGQSNLAQVPYYGPPLSVFGFPGFPFFAPPLNPQTIFDQTNAHIKSIQDQIANQINEQAKQNDCEPTEVYTEDYTVGGKNYTYIRKTCKVNGPNGMSSSTSSSTIPKNSGSSSSSDSGPSVGSSSSSSSGPSLGPSSSSSSGSSPVASSSSSSSSLPTSDQSSSSSSGPVSDSISSSSSSSSPNSDQGSSSGVSSGPAASSVASSGPGVASGASSGAYSSAGGGMSVAAASGK